MVILSGRSADSKNLDEPAEEEKNSLDLFGLALFWFSFIASTKFRWLFCCDVRRIVPKN